MCRRTVGDHRVRGDRPRHARHLAAARRAVRRRRRPCWCWCQFWRKPGSNWSNASVDQNRDDLRALVDGPAPAPGLVAINDDGKAVGWVGLGPREVFERLPRSRTIPQLAGDDVWVVNCFVVARTARRSGVASALLDAAVAYAAERGAAILEGYPVDTRGTRISSASVYTGTTGMFRARRLRGGRADDLEGRLGHAARGDAPGTLALIPAAQPELCTARSSRRADATNGAPTGRSLHRRWCPETLVAPGERPVARTRRDDRAMHTGAVPDRRDAPTRPSLRRLSRLAARRFRWLTRRPRRA